MKDEKYIDEEFVKGLLNMFNGAEGDAMMASQIFDNILDNEEDMNNFIDNFDVNKAKIIESKPIPNKEYKIDKNYLKICLEHTKWSLEQNKNYKNDFNEDIT
jgi:hypothetical protein